MTSREHALDQVLKLANQYWEHEGDYLQQLIEVGTSWVDYPQHGISGPIARGELLLEARHIDPQKMPRFFARVGGYGDYEIIAEMHVRTITSFFDGN